MIFKKRKFYKIIYKSDKTVEIEKINNVDTENILINPNHIYFDSRGNRYILTSDKSAESINPLDFSSQFSAKEFRTAIETKLISDLFKNFDDKKLSIDRILLFVNIFISFIVLYFLIMKR